MAHDSDPAAPHPFILQTYGFYVSLIAGETARSSASSRDDMGGQLFWAGDLDEVGRALTVAGNIAGAATFAATSDTGIQRQIVRDGVVDFLVNTLDEALRILKNEVRKRETVAVCVAAPLDAVESEMLERGVRPDVFREAIVRATDRVRSETPITQPEVDPMSAPALVTWKVDRAPALWLPKLDAIALECLAPEESVSRRWLQRSSRYLGRVGQAEHLVRSNREFAARFFERLRESVDREEIKVGGSADMLSPGAGPDQFRF